MLILSRTKNKRIVLVTPEGDRIYIQVCEIDRNVVKIGVEAPPYVTIHREEVQDEIDRSH